MYKRKRYNLTDDPDVENLLDNSVPSIIPKEGSRMGKCPTCDGKGYIVVEGKEEPCTNVECVSGSIIR